jgi:hypothetical protein
MIRNAVLAGSGSRSTAEVSYKIDIPGKDFSGWAAQLSARGRGKKKLQFTHGYSRKSGRSKDHGSQYHYHLFFCSFIAAVMDSCVHRGWLRLDQHSLIVRFIRCGTHRNGSRVFWAELRREGDSVEKILAVLKLREVRIRTDIVRNECITDRPCKSCSGAKKKHKPEDTDGV